ncbi:camt-1 [Bugula neritina]|uniref:Camt-1 n=1 Tax=Bugula neritina TaxID=10212 RepID=A0A7J7J6J0_BUGNE|nr:camt-1 [Bugula neritina]
MSCMAGGCKVLLVGPWKAATNTYSCIFGDKTVPAEFVQDGVLSCITPAHKQGSVQVTVACLDKIISESCQFEFRDRKYESLHHKSWFLCEESRLQMALVDRIEQIKCRLDILFPPPILADNMNLEQRVSALVQNIQRYKWRSKEPLPSASFKGLTLFHLAAALGYRTLLETLVAWRNESSSDILANEVSASTPDNNGCFPLHWACALGRMETALVLYYMDRLVLDEINKEGMTPLSLARAFRNKHIVEMLVQQEHSVLESKLEHQGLNKCTLFPINTLSGGLPLLQDAPHQSDTHP